MFWAAGFSFSRASLIADVPYDPALKFLFFGEEMAMLCRMWTRGYDLFAPTRALVFHHWRGPAAPPPHRPVLPPPERPGRT